MLRTVLVAKEARTLTDTFGIYFGSGRNHTLGIELHNERKTIDVDSFGLYFVQRLMIFISKLPCLGFVVDD